MNQIHVDTLKWYQSTEATDENGKPVKVSLIGRVVDEINTYAVSVPPRGATKYFCSEHKRLFPIGRRCPDCTARDVTVAPSVTLVTAAMDADLPVKVS